MSLEHRVEYQSTDGSGRCMNMIVDIVAEQGSCWVKVFTRKRQALHRKWLGR